MHQHSNMPERIHRDAVDIANQPEALQVQQLLADLWLERGLNELQSHLNRCLISAFQNQKSPKAVETEIFQTLVQQLSRIFKTDTVAIALPGGLSPLAFMEATGIHESCPSQIEPEYQICYVVEAATPTTLTLNTKKINLQLHERLTLKDLQYLQNQKPPLAWAIQEQSDVTVGWLIAVTPSLQPNATFADKLKIQLQPQLIAQSLSATMLAISQIKRLQALTLQHQQLDRHNCELARTNQLKSEFLANTSHEIRTPLSSILGFTHLLLAKGYNPGNLRHQEYLNIILTSGQHLLALINDILDLSKIEANQLEVNKETVNIAELCRSVIGLVKEKASNKNLQLQLDINNNATTLVADSLRLKQMLFNLLSNALKFTNKGAVGLQVQPKGVYIHFTVWDTGTGIAKEKQPKLFQPYFQISNVVAGSQEGTGLGLALTQKLAQLHGGWIELQSEINRGSQFTIVLPLTDAVATSENVEQLQQLESRNRDRIAQIEQAKLPAADLLDSRSAPLVTRRAIMLVEDNFHNAKLMTTYLRKLGYLVTWVNSAAQMWEALKKEQPAVILMDVHLPDVDGLTLVQQLQTYEQYRKIPVIAQTAMAMKGDRETCLAAGAVDYISKPIDLKALANLVLKYSDPDH